MCAGNILKLISSEEQGGCKLERVEMQKERKNVTRNFMMMVPR